MENIIIKTELTGDEQIAIVAIAQKEALSNTYRVNCHYIYTGNPKINVEESDIDSENFKTAFKNIEKWCRDNNYIMWSY